jgi:hypothetical protein
MYTYVPCIANGRPCMCRHLYKPRHLDSFTIRLRSLELQEQVHDSRNTKQNATCNDSLLTGVQAVYLPCSCAGMHYCLSCSAQRSMVGRYLIGAGLRWGVEVIGPSSTHHKLLVTTAQVRCLATAQTLNAATTNHGRADERESDCSHHGQLGLQSPCPGVSSLLYVLSPPASSLTVPKAPHSGR